MTFLVHHRDLCWHFTVILVIFVMWLQNLLYCITSLIRYLFICITKKILSKCITIKCFFSNSKCENIPTWKQITNMQPCTRNFSHCAKTRIDNTRKTGVINHHKSFKASSCNGLWIACIWYLSPFSFWQIINMRTLWVLRIISVCDNSTNGQCTMN